MSDETKQCGRCGQRLPLEQFYADKGAPGGRTNRCKACDCELARERRRLRGMGAVLRKPGRPRKQMAAE